MTTDPFEIIDVHLHAWSTVGMDVLFGPHEPVPLDESVYVAYWGAL